MTPGDLFHQDQHAGAPPPPRTRMYLQEQTWGRAVPEQVEPEHDLSY